MSIYNINRPVEDKKHVLYCSVHLCSKYTRTDRTVHTRHGLSVSQHYGLEKSLGFCVTQENKTKQLPNFLVNKGKSDSVTYRSLHPRHAKISSVWTCVLRSYAAEKILTLLCRNIAGWNNRNAKAKRQFPAFILTIMVQGLLYLLVPTACFRFLRV